MTWTQIKNHRESNWNNQRPNINLKHPRSGGRWVSTRGWMRETEKHEWMDGNRKRATDWRLRPLGVTRCQSVSVTMTGLQQWGNPERLRPRRCSQGLHMLTDRAKGCPVHSISQPRSPTAYLTPAAHAPVSITSTVWYRRRADLTACSESEKWKLRRLYSFWEIRSRAV